MKLARLGTKVAHLGMQVRWARRNRSECWGTRGHCPDGAPLACGTFSSSPFWACLGDAHHRRTSPSRCLSSCVLLRRRSLGCTCYREREHRGEVHHEQEGEGEVGREEECAQVHWRAPGIPHLHAEAGVPKETDTAAAGHRHNKPMVLRDRFLRTEAQS